nr:hypothetical protein [Tanacetum cinerariifolium]
MQDDEAEPAKLKEIIEVVTIAKLLIKVVTAAATSITTAPSAARRRKDVVIKDPKETSTPSIIVHSEPKSKNKGKGIMVEEPKPLKKQVKIEQDEAYARELEAELNANINWGDVIEQIIRADGTHQLFLSFISLLRNFDKEDLEVLWKIVQERFSSSKPKNFLDDFLLNTLKIIFEKPDVEAQVWKNQRGSYVLAKVKSWKLLKSRGVYIIAFTTIQMILLVERRYPLKRFTLDQMLNNVRLEVKEESEVSLELLRFEVCHDLPLDQLPRPEEVLSQWSLERLLDKGLVKSTHIRHVPLCFLMRIRFAAQVSYSTGHGMPALIRSAPIEMGRYGNSRLIMTLCYLRVCLGIGSHTISYMLPSSLAAAKLVSSPGDALGFRCNPLRERSTVIGRLCIDHMRADKENRGDSGPLHETSCVGDKLPGQVWLGLVSRVPSEEVPTARRKFPLPEEVSTGSAK